MTGRRISVALLAIALVLVLAFVAFAWRPSIELISSTQIGNFDEALIRRGGELAALGNCNVCHTEPGGKPFAGGREILTSYGIIYATNITPDPETGIGRWSEEAFQRAMYRGVDREGRHLYPAFPYDHFTLLTEADNKAIYAYLMSREPVRKYVVANEQLHFPYNVRSLVAAWKLLFFRKGPYQPDPLQSEEWNRGAYLVRGVGHCGACHTPRNAFGAEKKGEFLAGGEVEGWTAYALNKNSPAPVPWDADALFAYLRHGWHEAHGVPRGPMAPVVFNLATVVPDADVRAIATYLATEMGEPTPERRRQAEALLEQTRNFDADGKPVSGDGQVTTGQRAGQSQLGAMIYASTCAGCHESRQPLPFGGIHLALSTGVHGPTPHNLINVILFGLPAAEGERSPIMPGYAGVMSDEQLTELVGFLRARFSEKPPWPDVLTQVRNARTGQRPVAVYPSPGVGLAPEASRAEKP